MGPCTFLKGEVPGMCQLIGDTGAMLSETHTSTVLSTSALTLTVKFLPGEGGSGLTLISLI